ncbi:MAG: magnesium-translocating P-type ATPase, partial [Sandaracinaceae bacterium]|nr:magnesium-translocating P-type ATPase [Sandaracinaceae bacterium]
MFDLLTFYALYIVVRASAPEFRTGWFVESLLTELAVAFVVRTRRPFFRSRPAKLLTLLSIAVAVVALVLPWTRLGALIALTPLPLPAMAMIVTITLAYVLTVEVFKRWFFARYA